MRKFGKISIILAGINSVFTILALFKLVNGPGTLVSGFLWGSVIAALWLNYFIVYCSKKT